MIINKRILFIAPLPPPIDGQSKTSLKVLDVLKSAGYSVLVINTNRNGLNRGLISQIKRFFVIIKFFFLVLRYRFCSDIIYISLSESVLGNIKDNILFLILLGKLNKVILHMLGGSGMNQILNNSSFLSKINLFFMKRIRSVIVEGSIGYDIFGSCFQQKNIHVVRNCVDDFLISKLEDVEKKFINIKKLNVLYLSNLIKEKGYQDLFEAFISLPKLVKDNINIKFVGDFCTDYERLDFLKNITYEANIEYLGKFIDGQEKFDLYMNTHVFCLPTYYPYEGQPISILEAYATGCSVITTNHGGIPEIFNFNKNGYLVLPGNPCSISFSLQKSLSNLDELRNFAINNFNEAKIKYRINIFNDKILEIFKGI